MTPLFITISLTIILLTIMIWSQFSKKSNQTYFKIGAAAVLVLFVWLSEDRGKNYYALLISILAVSIAFKEFLSLKKPNAKSAE